MKVVLLDSYDSFTYNLAHYLRDIDDVQLTLLKNDGFSLTDLDKFDKIVISPGPGVPKESGFIVEVIRHYSGTLPILGICLGMQAIYESSGGVLLQLERVHHGVSSAVYLNKVEDLIFSGISSPFMAGRYHSWVCDPAFLPEDLVITSTDNEGAIMSCRHKTHPTYGVQFHPESILTPAGKKMIRNFIELVH